MIKLLRIGLYSAILSIFACSPQNTTNAQSTKNDSTMQYDTLNPKNLEVATLGAGCFWCVEAVFDELKGVEKSISGYSGGNTENPTYKDICYGNTGHAEVVNVYFDPTVVSFEDILRVFFHVHDPTTLNRQGNDVGPQYRSAIFYHSDAQKASAEKIIAEVEQSGLWSKRIVTEVTKFKKFYTAEDYHQEYYKLNGSAPYCSFVISPKMAKFRKDFKDKLKE
jgi:peptide-methionine (S)-S-oxide reductase